MKKKVLYYMIICCSLLFISCSKESEWKLEDLQQSYDEQQSEYDDLLKTHSKLISDYDKVKLEFEAEKTKAKSFNGSDNKEKLVPLEVQEYIDELEFRYESLKTWYDLLGSYDDIVLSQECLSKGNWIVNSYDNIFDPYTIKENDSFNGYIVKEVSISDSGQEDVYFEGNFILTGELYFSPMTDNACLSLSKAEKAKNLPISTTELDYYKFDRNINLESIMLENEEEVIQAVGKEKYNLMEETLFEEKHVTYIVTAVFNNYHHAFLYESDLETRMELVEILSIKELIN